MLSAAFDRPLARGSGSSRPRIAVVVLGDVGRSPRMQYHALALADRLADVELIGLSGSEPLSEVRTHPRIDLRLLADGNAGPRSLAAAGARVARLTLALWRALRGAPPLDAILIQNPPAVPTLAIALLAARRHRAPVIVDWHNLGYAMLALRVGAGHPAVRLAAGCERALARRAAAHLCVSRAMQAQLAARWAIDARVLHDQPAARFATLPTGAREAAARDVCARFGLPAAPRPVLIVTATSWSADEDFDLLLDAVASYERRGSAAVPLLILISGRGPRRAAFEARIARRAAERVRVATVWLPPDEYPRLLASADLGVCLHRSASGLDLPMKIADMLGAGLPVLALDYAPCLREMIEPSETALLFSTADQLADRLHELCAGFPADTAALNRLRAGVAARAGERWEDAWEAHARPLFESVLGREIENHG